MPREQRTRLRTSSKPALDLPPPFRLVTLREVGDAFAHATKVAAAEGAGTLVYVGRFDLAEFAVVLEPEEPLRTARRALYAGLVALADALAARAPPERPISFDWPDAVLVDGGARRRRPPRLAAGRGRERAAGMGRVRRHDPHRGDGRGGTGPAATLGGARGRGFRRSRLRPAGGELRPPSHGRRRRLAGARIRRNREGLSRPACAGDGSAPRHRRERRSAGAPDRNGQGPDSESERRSLLHALAQPSWLDPTTGGPRR